MTSLNTATGPPKTVIISKKILKIHSEITHGRETKVIEIVGMVKVLTNRSHHILTNELGLVKLLAMWLAEFIMGDMQSFIQS